MESLREQLRKRLNSAIYSDTYTQRESHLRLRVGNPLYVKVVSPLYAELYNQLFWIVYDELDHGDYKQEG